MTEITGRNVNDIFFNVMSELWLNGQEEETRNGPVLVSPEPVRVTYRNPTERVLFSMARDANPFFHFMEGLWMLNGQRDVKTVAHYNKRMAEFSDDGKIFHAAYGHRWRSHFCLDGDEPMDQLQTIIQELRTNPQTRRAVLTMWDPMSDLGRDGKDFPCNTHAYFRVRGDSVLDMTVCNRSNDIIWGLAGANAVHLSMMHEVVAAHAGFATGRYYQFTNNFHAYRKVFDPLWEKLKERSMDIVDGYGDMDIVPMVDDPRTWFADLTSFMSNPGRYQTTFYTNRFFSDVAQPIAQAWEHWKNKNINAAKKATEHCTSEDWAIACYNWLVRREA